MCKFMSFFLIQMLWPTVALAQADPDVERRIDQLITLVRDGEFDQASAEAASMVSAHPYSYASHMAAFRTHFAAFQYQPDNANSAQHLEEALKRLNFARRLEPLNLEAWELSVSFWSPSRVNPEPPGSESQELLGQAADLLDGGEVDKAIEKLQKVIELEPDYPPTYIHLGEIYLNKGDHGEALRLARSATEKNPRDPAGALLQARSQAMLGRGERALEALITSLKTDPAYPPAWEMFTQLDLGGKKAEHMATHFPKVVLWLIDQEIEEPSDADLVGVSEVTRPAWKAYITTKVRWRKVNFKRRNPEFKVYRYTFREELTAITDMLVVWQEVRASRPEARDLLLDQWLDASQAGALEAAVFVDLFVEQFRQDFTGWKRTNPAKFEEYFFKFWLPRISKQQSPPQG